MNTNEYFLSCSDTMPSKNIKTSSRRECTISLPSLPPGTEDLMAASKTSALNPALRQAIHEMMDNISKNIDKKLSSLSQMLQAHALELQNFGKRANKAEEFWGWRRLLTGPICRLRHLRRWCKAWLNTLITLKTELAEKYTYYQTAWRCGGIRSTNFFESWLPDVLHKETKDKWVTIEEAQHKQALNPAWTSHPSLSSSNSTNMVINTECLRLPNAVGPTDKLKGTRDLKYFFSKTSQLQSDINKKVSTRWISGWGKLVPGIPYCTWPR